MAKFNCNVISYTLKRTVDITVIIPTPTIPEAMGLGGCTPCHTPKADYPVLYLLHGFGNNHATWSGYTNVELYAEERNIAVVMVSAENKFYINHENGDLFYDFISKELPEFITSMFPVSPLPENTYIAGLSMGGFGSLVHALAHPDHFAAFGAFSAAVGVNPSSLTGSEEKPLDPAYDPLALATNIHTLKATYPKAYIACGETDFLYEANVAFKNKLIGMGAEVTWITLPGYGHEWRFWNLQIEAFLDWIPRTDYYASMGKRQV